MGDDVRMVSRWGCEVGRLMGVAEGFLGPGSGECVRGRVSLTVVNLPSGIRLIVGVVENADP
jgi:hypothetical protein